VLRLSFSVESGSISFSVGTRYDSSAQRARSWSLHRSLQKGRHAGSTGCRLQPTHNSTFDGSLNPAMLPSCNAAIAEFYIAIGRDGSRPRDGGRRGPTP